VPGTVIIKVTLLDDYDAKVSFHGLPCSGDIEITPEEIAELGGDCCWILTCIVNRQYLALLSAVDPLGQAQNSCDSG